MDVAEKIVRLLLDAGNEERGCLLVLRCVSSDAMAEAFQTLTAQADLTWNTDDATTHASVLSMVQSAESHVGRNDVSLWLKMPDARGSDGLSTFYDGLDDRIGTFLGNQGPRAVVLVNLGAMQSLAKLAPVAWKSKTAFLAWPEKAKPAAQRRTVPPVNQQRVQHERRGGNNLTLLEEQIAKESDPRILSDLYRRQSNALAESGRLEEARKSATMAARLFRDHGALEKLAECYELLASIAERTGVMESARDWMTFALETWQMVGNDERIAESHAKKGHLHYLLGDRDTAAKQFQLAIALDEAKGRSAKVAAGLRRLGLMAEDAGRLKIAYKLYKESMDLVERLGDRIGLSRVHHHMGRLAERSNNFTQAFEHHKQSLELKEALNDTVGMASSYHHLGNTYYGSRDLRMAAIMYEQALELESETQDHHGRANTLLQLALVQSERFNWESALHYALCAHQAWRKLGSKDGMKSAELRISTARTMVEPGLQSNIQREVLAQLESWGIR